jgi:hypothetical protein
LGGDKVIDMNDEIHGLYLKTSLTTDGTVNSETGTFSNILSRIPITTNIGGDILHTPQNSSQKLQISMPVIKMIGVKLTDDKKSTHGFKWIKSTVGKENRLSTLILRIWGYDTIGTAVSRRFQRCMGVGVASVD